MIKLVKTSTKHIITFTYPPALMARTTPISCFSLRNWLDYDKNSEALMNKLRERVKRASEESTIILVEYTYKI